MGVEAAFPAFSGWGPERTRLPKHCPPQVQYSSPLRNTVTTSTARMQLPSEGQRRPSQASPPSSGVPLRHPTGTSGSVGAKSTHHLPHKPASPPGCPPSALTDVRPSAPNPITKAYQARLLNTCKAHPRSPHHTCCQHMSQPPSPPGLLQQPPLCFPSPSSAQVDSSSKRATPTLSLPA